MRLAPIITCILLCTASMAFADRRALSVDVGAGWNFAGVNAPGAFPPHSTLTMGPSVWLGGRYALTHHVEVSAVGFFDVPVTVAHNGIVLRTTAGDFPGTLVHQTLRYGGQAGARVVFGMVWKFVAGLDLGVSARNYSAQRMLNDVGPEVIDYGLSLSDVTRVAFVASPLVGVEWAAGDKWSLAVLPRAQLQFGAQFEWAIIVPLQFSWSWYL